MRIRRALVMLPVLLALPACAQTSPVTNTSPSASDSATPDASTSATPSGSSSTSASSTPSASSTSSASAKSSSSASGASATPSKSASPTPTALSSAEQTANLKKSVQGYSDAFLAGKADPAYRLLSSRCQKKWTSSQFGALVTTAGNTYGAALPLESFSAKISGDIALVSYTYILPALKQEREPWLLESGSWKNDDCPTR